MNLSELKLRNPRLSQSEILASYCQHLLKTPEQKPTIDELTEIVTVLATKESHENLRKAFKALFEDDKRKIITTRRDIAQKLIETPQLLKLLATQVSTGIYLPGYDPASRKNRLIPVVRASGIPQKEMEGIIGNLDPKAQQDIRNCYNQKHAVQNVLVKQDDVIKNLELELQSDDSTQIMRAYNTALKKANEHPKSLNLGELLSCVVAMTKKYEELKKQQNNPDLEATLLTLLVDSSTFEFLKQRKDASFAQGIKECLVKMFSVEFNEELYNADRGKDWQFLTNTLKLNLNKAPTTFWGVEQPELLDNNEGYASLSETQKIQWPLFQEKYEDYNFSKQYATKYPTEEDKKSFSARWSVFAHASKGNIGSFFEAAGSYLFNYEKVPAPPYLNLKPLEAEVGYYARNQVVPTEEGSDDSSHSSEATVLSSLGGTALHSQRKNSITKLNETPSRETAPLKLLSDDDVLMSEQRTARKPEFDEKDTAVEATAKIITTLVEDLVNGSKWNLPSESKGKLQGGTLYYSPLYALPDEPNTNLTKQELSAKALSSMTQRTKDSAKKEHLESLIRELEQHISKNDVVDSTLKQKFVSTIFALVNLSLEKGFDKIIAEKLSSLCKRLPDEIKAEIIEQCSCKQQFAIISGNSESLNKIIKKSSKKSENINTMTMQFNALKKAYLDIRQCYPFSEFTQVDKDIDGRLKYFQNEGNILINSANNSQYFSGKNASLLSYDKNNLNNENGSSTLDNETEHFYH